MTPIIVVTRHKALVAVLKELQLVPDDVTVIEHATPEDVTNRVVVGVLPLHLAALATGLVEVTLDIPVDMRGKELDEAQIKQYMKGVKSFIVKQVSDENSPTNMIIQSWRSKGD